MKTWDGSIFRSFDAFRAASILNMFIFGSRVHSEELPEPRKYDPAPLLGSAHTARPQPLPDRKDRRPIPLLPGFLDELSAPFQFIHDRKLLAFALFSSRKESRDRRVFGNVTILFAGYENGGDVEQSRVESFHEINHVLSAVTVGHQCCV